MTQRRRARHRLPTHRASAAAVVCAVSMAATAGLLMDVMLANNETGRWAGSHAGDGVLRPPPAPRPPAPRPPLDSPLPGTASPPPEPGETVSLPPKADRAGELVSFTTPESQPKPTYPRGSLAQAVIVVVSGPSSAGHPACRDEPSAAASGPGCSPEVDRSSCPSRAWRHCSPEPPQPRRQSRDEHRRHHSDASAGSASGRASAAEPPSSPRSRAPSHAPAHGRPCC